jgi:hypothetical protein
VLGLNPNSFFCLRQYRRGEGYPDSLVIGSQGTQRFLIQLSSQKDPVVPPAQIHDPAFFQVGERTSRPCSSSFLYPP